MSKKAANKNKLMSKSIVSIIVLVLIFDIVFALVGTVLFDKKEYYGKPNTILSYDDIFFNFESTDKLAYSYMNFAPDEDFLRLNEAFEKINPVLQSTEYKVVPKYKARFLVLFQNKSNSCGGIRIDEMTENGKSEEYKSYISASDSKLYYARIFKLAGKYYLYYYPKTETEMSGFTLCEIQNTEEFKADNYINASTERFIYPNIYPSYMMNLKYNHIFQLVLMLFFALEVGVIYMIIIKIKNKRK